MTNPPDPNPRKRKPEPLPDPPTTRSHTKVARDEAQEEQRRLLEENAERERARWEEDIRNRPPVPAGSRGDGRLYLASIRVGQGDSAVLTTPQGRVLVFDCGSDATEGEGKSYFATRLRGIFAKPMFLRDRDVIDALILTHPDTDHYNMLKDVLGTSYRLRACYHSSIPHNYACRKTSTWVHEQLQVKTNFWRVTLDDDPANGAPGSILLNENPVQPPDGDNRVNRLDGQGGIRIVDEPNCKISIVAAGVNHVYTPDNSNPNNRGSIVTLIEAFGNKILLCGDATVNTERFLLNTTNDRLRNVTLLQIGHHGSINTSSSEDFARHVNPATGIASAGQKIALHHLPSERALSRYVEIMTFAGRAPVVDHPAWCWEAANWGSYIITERRYAKAVYTTGSSDTYYYQCGAPL